LATSVIRFGLEIAAELIVILSAPFFKSSSTFSKH
jgi:hypothetical protein